MNNDHVRRFAGHFARFVVDTSDGHVDARVTRAYTLALGRPPDASERADARRLLSQSTDAEALVDLCHALFCLNEFLYIE